MELEVILPPTAEKIAPIFVTSPTNHSGGGLIQRTVCASTNGICFGDNLFDEFLSQIDWALELVERHQTAKDIEQSLLNNVLNGEVRTWMPELGLPLDLYTAALMSVIYNLPHTAQSYAKEESRSIWMVARASVAGTRLIDLLNLFPMAKMVIIHRNPLDIIRDALRDHPTLDISELCQTWNQYMRDYLDIKSDRVIKLHYEHAQSDVEGFSQALTSFTGIEGITEQLRNAGCEAELSSESELSETLVAQIQSNCTDMLSVYYPDLVSKI